MKFTLKTSLLMSAIIGLSSSMYACKSNGDNGASISALSNQSGKSAKTLTRIATAPLGAEFTGMFANEDGSFFLNVQHPDSANTTADKDGKMFGVGTVGAIVGVDFNALAKNIEDVPVPSAKADQEVVKTAVGRYQVLLQQNDALIEGNKAGDIVNNATVQRNSNDPDFNGVISDGGTGYYVYSNWEDRAGGMSRTRVSGLSTSGYSTVLKEGMLDFSGVNGTWVNCFGTVSPWNTPLTSEELYFDDTANWYTMSNDPQSMAAYLGYPTNGTGAAWPNPYDYGYIVEIGVNNTAKAAKASDVHVNKLELLGRFSHENAVVMPDLKTVFLSDDGGSTVFFKFVADIAGDLSNGTLYAAKVTQSADTDAAKATFKINWIKLATGNEAAIENVIRSYDGSYADAKHITDTEINVWANSKKGVVGATNPFADDRPAFLESRKAAKAMGASAEFNKMEGVVINFDLAKTWWNNGLASGKQAYMYMAMSDVTSAMSDGAGDIKVGQNRCGVVYRMKLVKNTDGNVDITEMIPALAGGTYAATATPNKCAVESIASPDNLVILKDGRVMIGEDTGHHQNNMVWLFQDPAI